MFLINQNYSNICSSTANLKIHKATVRGIGMIKIEVNKLIKLLLAIMIKVKLIIVEIWGNKPIITSIITNS